VAVDEARLNTSVEKKDNCIRVVDVEVSREEIDDRMDKLFTELMPTVSIPGFRPGRAPRKLVERRLRKTVRQEAVDEIVADSFETVCEVENIRPVSEPTVENVQSEPDSPIKYQATVEIEPVVELGQYKELEIERQVCTVTDERVEAAIERLREDFVTIEPVEGRSARVSDLVVLDLDVFKDGERVDDACHEGLNLWLEEDGPIPELRDMLVGTEPGNKFEGEMTFPENARVSVAGQRVQVSGTVKEVKERIVPKLDDEFANQVNADFHTVDDIRADVRARIEREVEAEADQRLGQVALERVIENSTYELPQSLIQQLAYDNLRDQTSRLHMYGVSDEVLRERHGELWERSWLDAEHSLKVHSTLTAIARKEKIEVADEEIEEEIGKIRQYGERMGWNLERLDEHYAQSGPRESVQARMIREKTVQLILDSATLKRVEVDTFPEDELSADTTEVEDE